MGLKKVDQDGLFESFSRVESSGTRHANGTGLGLYPSWRLAELLGGRILVESDYGKGSKFTLMLEKKQ